MRTFKINFIRLFIGALSMTMLWGCKKKDDDTVTPAKTTHKVVFKAETSAGCSIQSAAYGYDSNFSSASGLSGTTWTSTEITTPSNASVASASVNAVGVNTSSTLKVQVYVDGILKKEGTSSGPALSANVQYSF